MKLDARYDLLEPIGSGGFGSVHRGRDHVAKRDVAIKRLKVRDHAQRIRVRRELAVLRSVRLPNVVRFFDELTRPDETLIVMELVQGTSFPGENIGRDWEALRTPTLSLLETIGRLHDAGIVHRDIKPANVLVRPDGQIVVVDFGTSHVGDVIARYEKRRKQSGTPKYMAPERFRGNTIDARSDLYSIGVMLFQAFTGQTPHPASSLSELVELRLHTPAPSLGELRPDLPTEVHEAVDQLLERRPDDRPQHAAEVLALVGRHPYTDRIEKLVRRDGTNKASIMAWFVGPERLARRQSRAANELIRRSGGNRDKIIRELRAWQRAEIVHWRDDKLAIRDADLVRLESGLALVPQSQSANTLMMLDELRLLRLLEREFPTDISSLMRLSGWPANRVDKSLTRLLSHGQVTIDSSGLWSLTSEGRASLESMPQDLSHHRHPLVGIISALRSKKFAEAMELVEARLADGTIARLDLHEALDDALFAFCPAEDLRSLERVVKHSIMGLSIFKPGRARAILARVDRLPRTSLRIEYMRTMLMAAEKAVTHRFDAAEEAIRELGPCEDIELENKRWRILGFVRDRQGRIALRSFVDELQAMNASKEAKNELVLFFGARLAYVESRYEDSAALWRTLAGLTINKQPEIGALTNLMSPLRERGDFDALEAVAARIAEHPLRRHQPMETGRLEWAHRSAAYARGEVLSPDVELVDAIFELGLIRELSMSLILEAAIAWRCNDLETLTSIIGRWAKSGILVHRGFKVMKACLLFVTGLINESQARVAEDYAHQEGETEPTIASQAFHMLALGGHSRAREYSMRASELAQRVPLLDPALRRDLVSQVEIETLARKLAASDDTSGER